MKKKMGGTLAELIKQNSVSWQFVPTVQTGTSLVFVSRLKLLIVPRNTSGWRGAHGSVHHRIALGNMLTARASSAADMSGLWSGRMLQVRHVWIRLLSGLWRRKVFVRISKDDSNTVTIVWKPNLKMLQHQRVAYVCIPSLVWTRGGNTSRS
jgi:hypothetical protein